MTQEASMQKPNGLLGLLLDVYDKPVAVRIGTTLVKIAWVNSQPDCFVLELDPAEMEDAVEALVLDSVTAVKARSLVGQTGPEWT
jgi:hypothetical protein